jgi:hypothetical protein
MILVLCQMKCESAGGYAYLANKTDQPAGRPTVEKRNEHARLKEFANIDIDRPASGPRDLLSFLS